MRTLLTRLRHRPWTAAFLAALSAVGLVLSALVAAPVSSAAAAGCRVDYTVNQWTGGYTAAVKITNLGDPLSGWRLTWTYAGDQKVTSSWNATVTQSDRNVTATGSGWNGNLGTGGSAEFGLQGSYQSANPTPTAFALNGVTCNGAVTPTDPGTPPTTPPTSPTPPTTPPPGGGCDGAKVCDGFETQSGTAPSGDWKFEAPDCRGTGTVTVDSSVAHAGSKSIRVDGKAGYCNHAFLSYAKDLSTVGPQMYVRMWIRHTTALPAAHVSFVSMPDSSQGGKTLRVGGQNSALQWNREIDDATLPAQSPAGVALSKPLPTGSWQCLKLKIDTSSGNLDTWLNGQQVEGLHADGVPTADIDQQWLSRTTAPRPTGLRLGWESYGVGDDTLWFDDVAVSGSDIAC
ncbi:cellulose-binding domain-containing protein [Streptomyces chilikensis]|uniref:Cellulose-binding domain-containing protein n=1 Tax=Streptomyces chilikensis TaxID=1194079 RepID=A0ABV3EPY4_9ACTN